MAITARGGIGDVHNYQNITETITEKPKATEKPPACAPVFSGGEVVSFTSTKISWSYYFNKATSESVQAYVNDLENQAWTIDSEDTIASTTFWDIHKGTCYITLRYHSSDNGVILEIKLEAN